MACNIFYFCSPFKMQCDSQQKATWDLMFWSIFVPPFCLFERSQNPCLREHIFFKLPCLVCLLNCFQAPPPAPVHNCSASAIVLTSWSHLRRISHSTSLPFCFLWTQDFIPLNSLFSKLSPCTDPIFNISYHLITTLFYWLPLWECPTK